MTNEGAKHIMMLFFVFEALIYDLFSYADGRCRQLSNRQNTTYTIGVPSGTHLLDSMGEKSRSDNLASQT